MTTERWIFLCLLLLFGGLCAWSVFERRQAPSTGDALGALSGSLGLLALGSGIVLLDLLPEPWSTAVPYLAWVPAVSLLLIAFGVIVGRPVPRRAVVAGATALLLVLGLLSLAPEWDRPRIVLMQGVVAVISGWALWNVPSQRVQSPQWLVGAGMASLLVGSLLRGTSVALDPYGTYVFLDAGVRDLSGMLYFVLWALGMGLITAGLVRSSAHRSHSAAQHAGALLVGPYGFAGQFQRWQHPAAAETATCLLLWVSIAARDHRDTVIESLRLQLGVEDVMTEAPGGVWVLSRGSSHLLPQAWLDALVEAIDPGGTRNCRIGATAIRCGEALTAAQARLKAALTAADGAVRTVTVDLH